MLCEGVRLVRGGGSGSTARRMSDSHTLQLKVAINTRYSRQLHIVIHIVQRLTTALLARAGHRTALRLLDTSNR